MRFEVSNCSKLSQEFQATCSLLPLSRAWSPWPNWPRRRSRRASPPNPCCRVAVLEPSRARLPATSPACLPPSPRPRRPFLLASELATAARHGHRLLCSRRAPSSTPPRTKPTPQPASPRPQEAHRPFPRRSRPPERRRSGTVPPPAAARRGTAATDHLLALQCHLQVRADLLSLLPPSLAAIKPSHGRNRRSPFTPPLFSRPGTPDSNRKNHRVFSAKSMTQVNSAAKGSFAIVWLKL